MFYFLIEDEFYYFLNYKDYVILYKLCVFFYKVEMVLRRIFYCDRRLI